MKPPSKKRAGRDIPDLTKEELIEDIGGTDGEKTGDEAPEQDTEGDEGGGGYGRPRELGDDDKPV